jgi:hypothetical protein
MESNDNSNDMSSKDNLETRLNYLETRLNYLKRQFALLDNSISQQEKIFLNFLRSEGDGFFFTKDFFPKKASQLKAMRALREELVDEMLAIEYKLVWGDSDDDGDYPEMFHVKCPLFDS